MTLSDHDIRDYFASHVPWLWTWQDRGEVVTWAAGETIAFRPQLEIVLDRLEKQGLPPFGSLVLLLAACRANWSVESPALPAEVELLTRFFEHSDMIGQAFRGLDTIHRLRHHVQQPAAMAELAAMVFEATSHGKRVPLSGPLVEAFHNGLSPSQLEPFTADNSTRVLTELQVLRDGLARLDAESLQLRLKIGLEQSVEPAPIELPPAPTGNAARALITQLEDDEQLGGVARLARLLLAVVQLPRPLSDPEELPIGGVTDITNRGPLDRLMLSELAHDDLTLATRVAMNEALYLRREPLARPQPRERFVLLDSGLRMWGVPRVFAAAVGLAVAAQAGPRLEVRTFRADGAKAVRVDFGSAQGLTDHLAALDHRAHPGAALANFAKLVDQAGVSSDVLLVTGEDVLADPEFTQALVASGLDSLNLAVISRDGGFRLLQRTRGGSKTLREAHFDLDDVLKPCPKSVPLIDSRTTTDLPAIFGVQPFPLLLSHPVRLDNSWQVSAEVLTITGDGRLLHWTGPKRGAKQLIEGLPAGRLHWCRYSETDGFVTLVIGKLSSRGLYTLRYNLATGERNLRVLQLPGEHPRSVFADNGAILVTFPTQIAALDPISGELLDWMPWSHPAQGRIFATDRRATGADQWFALHFDGRKLQALPVCRRSPDLPPFVAVLDRRHAGPVGVTALGELVFLGTDVRRQIPLGLGYVPFGVHCVSRDGERFAFAHSSTNFDIANVLTGELSRPRVANPKEAVESPMFLSVAPRQLRTRFSGILVDDNLLMLVSPRGSFWPIVWDASREAIVLPKQPLKQKPTYPVVPFRSLDVERDRGYSLSEARWPNGSRAVLDSRGLLHLRCADRTIPECTIVLAEGVTAGWTSDGRLWGPAYFTGRDSDLPAKAAFIHTVVPLLVRLN